MNVEYRKVHKKCNEQRRINSECEAEIKRLNEELVKLRSQKTKDTPIEERKKKIAARNLQKENYPTYSDNEETEIRKESEKDNDPEIICTGWGNNTGFTRVSTLKKTSRPIGRPEEQQNTSPYSSGNESEGAKRKRNGGFKIPRFLQDPQLQKRLWERNQRSLTKIR